jgi:tetratricopeptide (TPR) repeat protein
VSLPRGLGAALLCAAALPASAGHDARDDAARAAVYDHLLSAGFSLNYDTPRLYCLAVQSPGAHGLVTADPLPAAMPRGTYDAPVVPLSLCREAGLVFYSGAVRWEGETAQVEGGLLRLHTRDPRVREPTPDRRTYRVERHPEHGWVVTQWTIDPLPGMAGPVASAPEQAATLRYWSLVERYARGQRQAAVEGLAAMSDGEVRRALADAPRRPAACAAMLHTDRAFSGAGGTAPARFAQHLDHARALVEVARQDGRDGQDFARRWFVAVTLKAHQTADGSLGRRLARAGRVAFPQDPELAMAWGRLEEAIAWHGPVWRTAAETPVSEAEAWGFRPPSLARALEVDFALREARRLFEAALGAEAGNVEARLRLGHVLLSLGDLDGAAGRLGSVPSLQPDPATAYLAHLFLGRVDERRARLPEAVAAYRRAVEVRPDSATGHLALSQALHRTGALEAARAALRDALATPTGALDPYRTYVLGGTPSADERLQALREEVSP